LLKPASTTRKPCARLLELDELVWLEELLDSPLELELEAAPLDDELPVALELELVSPELDELDDPAPLLLELDDGLLELDDGLLELDELLSDGRELEELELLDGPLDELLDDPRPDDELLLDEQGGCGLHGTGAQGLGVGQGGAQEGGNGGNGG
jgi:hypothetical protein